MFFKDYEKECRLRNFWSQDILRGFRFPFQSTTMLGSIRTILLLLFSFPVFAFQELEDDSRVISVALVDDKFEVLSGEKDIFLPGSTNR